MLLLILAFAFLYLLVLAWLWASDMMRSTTSINKGAADRRRHHRPLSLSPPWGFR